jgi:hypothetical protein
MSTPDLRPGEHWFTTALLGSGWAVVEMWLNNEHEDGLPVFPETYDTGIGRYETEAEAEAESRAWAAAVETRYIPRREA